MSRILIVEDNQDNMDVVRYLLFQRNHNILTAYSGIDGLAMAVEHQPDLILLDLAMPNMDGWHAARALRNDPVTQDIPIIAVTARALADDRQRAFDAGVDDYITKPIDVGTFFVAVDSMLRNRRSAPNSRAG